MGTESIPDRSTDPYPNLTENRTRHARVPVHNISSITNIILDADGNDITSKSIEAIKVCWIMYSDNEQLAYEKIMKK